MPRRSRCLSRCSSPQGSPAWQRAQRRPRPAAQSDHPQDRRGGGDGEGSEDFSGRCAAILSNGKRCPNAALLDQELPKTILERAGLSVNDRGLLTDAGRVLYEGELGKAIVDGGESTICPASAPLGASVTNRRSPRSTPSATSRSRAVPSSMR